MRPALGLLLFADYTLEELVGLGRLCEDLGYRSFWYTDVRFGRECYVGLSAIVVCHLCRINRPFAQSAPSVSLARERDIPHSSARVWRLG